MDREKASQDKRNVRDAMLKARINDYQMQKMQTDKIEAQIKRDEELKKFQREELRQQYFDMQRKNIEDFKMQKEATENLLMIKGPMGMNSHRNPSQAQIKQYHRNIQQTLMES